MEVSLHLLHLNKISVAYFFFQAHCEKEKARLRIRAKPSLFQHMGLHSSLSGKIQNLKVSIRNDCLSSVLAFWFVSQFGIKHCIFSISGTSISQKCWLTALPENIVLASELQMGHTASAQMFLVPELNTCISQSSMTCRNRLHSTSFHALYKHEWFWWSVLSEWLTIPIRRIIDKRSTLVGSARYLIRMSSEAPDCRCHSVSAIQTTHKIGVGSD